MEKKNSNIWYFLIIIIIILFILGAYKNVINHQKKEYLVINNRILESAKKCYLNNDCDGKITLKVLYEKKYLEIQVDPNTKENMKEDICIEYLDNETKFCEK